MECSVFIALRLIIQNVWMLLRSFMLVSFTAYYSHGCLSFQFYVDLDRLVLFLLDLDLDLDRLVLFLLDADLGSRKEYSVPILIGSSSAQCFALTTLSISYAPKDVMGRIFLGSSLLSTTKIRV